MAKHPGIFNDVIGPVMRGPSSSHTAASWRIARTAMDILDDKLEGAIIEFDRNGAWAPNYREQGTCMGINGGLLQLEITDERMKSTEEVAVQQGIVIEYKVSSFPTSHANTVRLTLRGISKKEVWILAISIGGGSFVIQTINGFKVNLTGDRYTLLFNEKSKADKLDAVRSCLWEGMVLKHTNNDVLCLYELQAMEPFHPDFLSHLQNKTGIKDVSLINPVMPVISGRFNNSPFADPITAIKYAEETKADLGDLGIIYEQSLSGLFVNDLNIKMKEIVEIVHKSIETGLSGTQYEDRILQQQSNKIKTAEDEGLIPKTPTNRIIAYVTALMESKSSMEVIVAIPTAGSCGTVGGTLRAVAENVNATQEQVVKAYFAAGITGVFFAQGPGFSAEEHGCQVECGAASGMAAAGLVQLLGGNARQALDAASMAIQNMIGLVCDPVADRVEVPCLGKNISAAMNAYSSAIMAISGFDAVIPLNEVIETVTQVSKSMPTCVKCTGNGGLAITGTSKEIKQKLEVQARQCTNN